MPAESLVGFDFHWPLDSFVICFVPIRSPVFPSNGQNFHVDLIDFLRYVIFPFYAVPIEHIDTFYVPFPSTPEVEMLDKPDLSEPKSSLCLVKEKCISKALDTAHHYFEINS